MTRVAGVVLAAGAGRRMGGPKADIVVGGERLVDRAARALTDAGCDTVHAVVRAGTRVGPATVLVNPDPDRGMRSSLQLAVDACPDVAALVVLLTDLPGVTAESVRGVVAGWRPGRVALGDYGATRGHPIVMSPGLWAEALESAAPDEGARRFLRTHPELVDLIAVPGDAQDVDTPDDLRSWLTGRSHPSR